MAKCSWCGNRFNRETVEENFNTEYSIYPFQYSCFRTILCYDCAVEAIEEGADGVYFDTCEECGTTFDYGEAVSDFESHFPWYNGTSLTDYWKTANKILCADCAMNYVE